ncbi:protein of unknown function [Kyrpidia spormannii]|uniref:Uncharacterized protein n=2 Tax=Kyrpidia spormannii TaxID=2055160 RepID=A0ACA8ZBP8_9BACL|nr:protein of unknown function [Kyrpidia spormannii]CAB3395591.1 protein of unknown function [Kyrpidia spormannii]
MYVSGRTKSSRPDDGRIVSTNRNLFTSFTYRKPSALLFYHIDSDKIAVSKQLFPANFFGYPGDRRRSPGVHL